MIIDNKHYINAIKLHVHLLVLDGIYMTICWTSDDCDGQVDLKLRLSVGQVILFPYFNHWLQIQYTTRKHAYPIILIKVVEFGRHQQKHFVLSYLFRISDLQQADEYTRVVRGGCVRITHTCYMV